jgi:hypothetical protein
MDVLSTAAGSAQAVRDAAAASDSAGDSRLALERELDRLNGALGAQAMTAAQHLNWMVLAQAFLLTSYLVVLVAGWSVPLPGKRWLLGAIAAFAAVSLVLGYAAQRGARDRIGPLRQGRKVVEQALERVAHRPVVFSRERQVVVALGEWATRLLPLLVLAGWAALTLYTLALQMPSDARVAVESRAETRAAGAPVAAPRAKAPARKTEETTAPAAAVAPEAEGDSGIAAFFRRAMNAPPAEAPEVVKP